MRKLPIAIVVRAARLLRIVSRRRAERLLSAALFERLREPVALEALLRELEGATDRVAITERQMALQLVHDRVRKGPRLRGPYYEEGEIVRHLEAGDARLVRRHLGLLREA
ncbi:MAG: hypothetical protein GXY23_00990 [Myxococcales bacterium]|nr:hypothetical protein [Myxococcales bacterium]